MSTTSTGSDPNGPRRWRTRAPRPLRNRPRGSGGRGAGRRATVLDEGSGRLPLVLTDREQHRLLEQSRKRGAAAAVGRRNSRSGAFDPWVLGGAGTVTYFTELASVRDTVREQARMAAADAERAELLRDERARSDTRTAEALVRSRDQLYQEADAEVRSSWDQLNRLAIRAVRWERFRDRVREESESRRLRTRFAEELALGAPTATPAPAPDTVPDSAPDPGRDTGPEDESLDPVGNADPDPAATPGNRQEAELFGGMVPPPDRGAGWEGMPERPGLPAWLTWAMLLVIAAVEIPIYWVAYQPFHGAGTTEADFLSGTLAVSTAVLMVLLPHLAGRTLRGRDTTGAVKAAAAPAVFLLGIWAFSGWALGDLRAKLVLRSPPKVKMSAAAQEFADAVSQPTLADSLHLDKITVTWMFVTLLLLSGGVGFLLGLLREHPYLESYRAALERRAARGREREEARTMVDRLRAVAESAEDRANRRAELLAARLRATDNLYEAAANSYLMGVMERSSDPAVTEAAMRVAATWPLLPRNDPGQVRQDD
ncbi:hypothetical protein AB0467_01480 [Streptomyces sp. NPDC052095]|uniref:hypothetical protein n=1 Tax=unclassified Streptomyces TaxID=2593676 RepID=UPI00344C10B6